MTAADIRWMFKQTPESLESHTRRWEGKQITSPLFSLFNFTKKSIASAVQLSHTPIQPQKWAHTSTIPLSLNVRQWCPGLCLLDWPPNAFLKLVLVRGFGGEYPSHRFLSCFLSFSVPPAFPLPPSITFFNLTFIFWGFSSSFCTVSDSLCNSRGLKW